MKINKNFSISKKHGTNIIVTNLLTGRRNKRYDVSDPAYLTLLRIYAILSKHSYSDEWKNKTMRPWLEKFGFTPSEIEARMKVEDIVIDTPFDEEPQNEEQLKDHMILLTEATQKLMDFFSEFSFSPSYRFVNTLAYVTNVKEYVKNYFAIQDHQYSAEVGEKVKSAEFKNIIESIRKFAAPKKEINSRMKLYFGEPGTGKTTQAKEEASKCIVCSSDMLPSDIMQNFAFEDGKAGFQKSDLWLAMENGEKIVLDEINMLPFETLRFLQGITDEKDSLDYKGFHIEIKKGFQIIGTMNLNVGGSTISIPAPLVDRCSEIKEFQMTAEALVKALI